MIVTGRLRPQVSGPPGICEFWRSFRIWRTDASLATSMYYISARYTLSTHHEIFGAPIESIHQDVDWLRMAMWEYIRRQVFSDNLGRDVLLVNSLPLCSLSPMRRCRCAALDIASHLARVRGSPGRPSESLAVGVGGDGARPRGSRTSSVEGSLDIG